MIFAAKLFTQPELFFLTALAVIPAICLHEYFHAQVALWCGDPTAALNGHLTLNPLRQMGILSIIMFLFLGIAWGAVPVDPRNLSRRGRVLTAFAGPFMNFCLFLFGWAGFSLLVVFRPEVRVPELLVVYFYLIGVYNIILFLFNMLPVPGLDGWNVLVQFVKIRSVGSELLKGAMILLIFLMLMAFPYIQVAAEIVMEWGVRLIAAAAGR